MPLIVRCIIEIKHALQVVSSPALVATIMHHGAYEPIAHKDIGCVAGTVERKLRVIRKIWEKEIGP